MESLFESGRVIDLVLCFVLVEAVALRLAFRRSRPAKEAAIDIACLLLPGVFLMLAVKAALVSADWRWTAAALAAALIAHLADLARRIGRAPSVRQAERQRTATGGNIIRTREGTP